MSLKPVPPEPPANQRNGWKLRILLPPNIAAAAARNAVVVRVLFVSPTGEALPPERARFGSGAGFLPAYQKGAAALKAACAGQWIGMAQLGRPALREIVAALRGTDTLSFANAPDTPLAWQGESLPGVTDALVEPANPPPRTAVPSPAPIPAARPSRHAKPVIDGSRHFLSVQAAPGSNDPFDPELVEFLRRSGFAWETSNRRWWLRDERKVLNLLASQRSLLVEAFGATFTPNFERNLGAVRTATVEVEASEEGSGFVVETRILAGAAAPGDISRALAEGRDYVEAEGAVYLLPKAALERLAEARRTLGGEAAPSPRARHRVRMPELVSAEEALAAASPGFRPPEAWAARSAALRNLSRLAPPPLSPALESTLRIYQKIGVAWMLHLDRSGLGGILADEMGLGKTLQALAMLSCIHSSGTEPPSLVVAPAGLVENWRREAARFTPGLRVLAHHGDARAGDASAFAGRDVVVTSYTTLARDEELFRQVDWRCVLGDEAQHVKNRATRNARALGSLRARTRLLLTGTPVENSVEDLVSLFSFLMPGFLGNPASDLRGEERSAWGTTVARKAAPYILRRTKRAVAPELPERIEQVLTCRLDPQARTAYLDLRRRCEEELASLEERGAGEGPLRLAALTHLLRLRQFCCDPRLLPEGLAPAGLASSKLATFLELLDEAVDGGHRLLVFSQFTSQLDLIASELQERGLEFLRIDGSTRDRVALCERFNTDPSIPVFLVSLKAGGTGLNLTGADTVVHYDPWWNPAVEAQATDRAHRIGQKRTVTSIKLVVEDSVEDKVLELQRTKRKLLEALMEESEAVNTLALADLRDLLR